MGRERRARHDMGENGGMRRGGARVGAERWEGQGAGTEGGGDHPGETETSCKRNVC